MLNLKNLKKEIKWECFESFIYEKHFKLSVYNNEIVFHYWNDNQLSNQQKNTLDLEIQAVKNEIDEMEKMFSPFDNELIKKKIQLQELENKFFQGCQERNLDKKNSFVLIKLNTKEDFEINLKEYITELFKVKTLQGKELHPAQILRDCGCPLLINWEKITNPYPNEKALRCFKIKE